MPLVARAAADLQAKVATFPREYGVVLLLEKSSHSSPQGLAATERTVLVPRAETAARG